MTVPTITSEYQDLVIEHAELRALRIRLNLTGTPADDNLESRATDVIAMAVQEAEAARTLTSRQIRLLAPGLRASISRMTAGPEESHADATARAQAAALKLRRWLDKAE